MFTTDYGVASLVLKEIPYRGQAYVRVLDVQPGQIMELIAECVSFCRMVGADAVYATGQDDLAQWPVYTSVYEMQGDALVDWEKTENLFPVTEQTVTRWREIYNERMRGVDNAATLESRDEKRILESGGAYFVHRQGELLGIGWLDEGKLLAVASAVPGAGERVMNTLMSLDEGGRLCLEVASTNERAIRLYERLGFIKTREISCWYRVFG
jgi:GNAT superfamily N-acetyltransferase